MIELKKKSEWDELEGLNEEDFYAEDNIENALEDDEISAEEAGFIKGFMEED